MRHISAEFLVSSGGSGIARKSVFSSIFAKIHLCWPWHGFTGNSGRAPSEASSDRTQSYTIVRGDTLSIICRRYYGRSTAKYYNALAKYNGIKNPHLIYPGRTLKIPPENVLLGVSP